MHRDKTFQKPSLRPKWTRSQTYHPYHQLSIWLSYCNLYDPSRSHNALEASQHLTSQISLFLGGFPQVRYTRVGHKYGALCNHSTQTILTNSTQVIHSHS